MAEHLLADLDALARSLAGTPAPTADQQAAGRRVLAAVQGWAQEAAEGELDAAAATVIAGLDAFAAGEGEVEDLVMQLEAVREMLCACGYAPPAAAPVAVVEAAPPAAAVVAAPPAAVVEAAPPAAGPPADLEILREFVVEAREQLAETSEQLLRLEKVPGDAAALAAVFRGVHTIKGVAGFLQLGPLEELAHAAEDLLDQARSGLRALTGDAFDSVFSAAAVLEALVGEVATAVTADRPPPARFTTATHALIARIRALVASAEPVPEVAEAAPASTGPVLPEPPAADGEGASDGRNETLRIEAGRLDRLMEMLGELVITESMAARTAAHELRAGSDVVRLLNRLNKLTRELQQHVGALRMVPVRATFQRMSRLARDVARRSGKQVELVATGGHTEVDKSVVERIGDPLLHLVRNAIDHGLESAADRQRAGKPATGRLELRAFYRGGNIVIEVQDDGRGLDERKIAAKARQRGLLRDGEVTTSRDLLRLICAPGFSTADTVSSISGRGVGMDVVKRQIDAMGGQLELTSEAGRGTCFSMQLPLTLAVMDGMVIRLGRNRYILPTLSLVRLVTADDGVPAQLPAGEQVLSLKDGFVPVLPLEQIYDSPRDGGDRGLAVIAEADGTRVAIFIDELVGQVQAVIKSLSGSLGPVDGVSGCAILPDGKVGLVLDIAGLIRLAATQHAASAQPARRDHTGVH